MKKPEAVIYIRYSGGSYFQKEYRMAKKQLKDYCLKKNYNIVGCYIDRKKSGLNDKRWSFNRMMKLLKSLENPIVVTMSFSMLSRSLDTTLNILNMINKESLKLETVDDSFYIRKNKKWLHL